MRKRGGGEGWETILEGGGEKGEGGDEKWREGERWATEWGERRQDSVMQVCEKKE